MNSKNLKLRLRMATIVMIVTWASQISAQSVITEVVFDWSSHDRRAAGSDNWPITWADDNHQYTSWGDGGGFGGTSSDGRVSLGVARIEGTAASYQGINVFGGKNSENVATFPGKSYGILSVDGTLYMWVMVENQYFRESELYWSTNHGATWTNSGWKFANLNSAFSVPTFLNFGKDYQGARDNYVYLYAPGEKPLSPRFNSADAIDLARVPKQQITDRDAHEFFAGLNGNGEPQWTTDISQRVPVFEDQGRVHWTIGVSYNPGLDRYLLFNNTRPNPSQSSSTPTDLEIYEAPEPWGPWTLIKSFPNWNSIAYTFSYYLAPKWISADGRDFTLVFSGTGTNDSWNTVRGTFVTTGPDNSPPTVPKPPANLITSQ